jgi:hypothetical protein
VLPRVGLAHPADELLLCAGRHQLGLKHEGMTPRDRVQTGEQISEPASEILRREGMCPSSNTLLEIPRCEFCGLSGPGTYAYVVPNDMGYMACKGCRRKFDRHVARCHLGGESDCRCQRWNLPLERKSKLTLLQGRKDA